MHNKLIIIGAGGHGKVIADIALKAGVYREIAFLDDDKETKECLGFPVLGMCLNAMNYVDEADFFVAIGNVKARKSILEQLKKNGATITTLIHPAAVIGSQVEIGEGTVVMAGTVINSNSIIGRGCIINTGSSVDHDCYIGDYVHVSVGAHVCGNVKIGEATWIGAGATVVNNIAVCCNCVIGAGAVVIKNIDKKGTYIGLPAKRK